MKISAILLSGGNGTRMGSPIPKQYLMLGEKPLVLHSFELLISSPLISEIIVVCDPAYLHLFPEATHALPGKRRQDSLFNGLQKTSPETTHILVHDGARPFLKQTDLEAVIHAGIAYGAATLATPVKATIKEASSTHLVSRTLDRSSLYEIQTPQVIEKKILTQGFTKDFSVTDDVSFAELLSLPVKLVMGSYTNIKITTPEDLAFARYLIDEHAKV